MALFWGEALSIMALFSSFVSMQETLRNVTADRKRTNCFSRSALLLLSEFPGVRKLKAKALPLRCSRTDEHNLKSVRILFVPNLRFIRPHTVCRRDARARGRRGGAATALRARKDTPALLLDFPLATAARAHLSHSKRLHEHLGTGKPKQSKMRRLDVRVRADEGGRRAFCAVLDLLDYAPALKLKRLSVRNLRQPLPPSFALRRWTELVPALRIETPTRTTSRVPFSLILLLNYIPSLSLSSSPIRQFYPSPSLPYLPLLVPNHLITLSIHLLPRCPLRMARAACREI
ncbi:hypothetical protein K438DRAFT_1990497 [Mycena galopus ATCC 62051]|nr:hypothetical protein K438DRAFT_1990497 [Mycena galopus ATCC 62051]